MRIDLEIVAKIKSFYNQYVMAEDRIIIVLAAVALLIGAIYISINSLTTHFHGALYMPTKWLYLAPILFILTIFALYARNITPRIAFFTRSYGLYFLIYVTLAVLTTGVQYTPFHLIDQHLAHIDQALGFNSVGLINWTYAHPLANKIFSIAYDSIGFQLFLVPLFIAFLMEKKSINIYFYATLFSYLIGTTIYYFFPTAGPTAVFHDPHFLAVQHDTYTKYLEVHHHLAITTTNGGMIAFPSFHVIWSTILAYVCYRRKWLFYPLAVFNTIVIASTLFLGWHYLTDVIGGLSVAAIAIIISHYVYNRFVETDKTGGHFTIFNCGLPFFGGRSGGKSSSSSSSSKTMPRPFSNA